MTELNNFIMTHKMDIVKNELSVNQLKDILKIVGFVPGEQFLGFIETYSYLAYEDVEFFGINSELKEKTNLNKSTWLLHKNYEATEGFYILEDKGDGYYILVNGNDYIFNFFAGDSDKPEPINMKLFEYILRRFSEARI